MWCHSQEPLNIQIIRSEDNLKDHLLIQLHELLVPFRNPPRPLAVVYRLLGGWVGIRTMVFAVLKDLQRISGSVKLSVLRNWPVGRTHFSQNTRSDVRKRDVLIRHFANIYVESIH